MAKKNKKKMIGNTSTLNSAQIVVISGAIGAAIGVPTQAFAIDNQINLNLGQPQQEKLKFEKPESMDNDNKVSIIAQIDEKIKAVNSENQNDIDNQINNNTKVKNKSNKKSKVNQKIKHNASSAFDDNKQELSDISSNDNAVIQSDEIKNDQFTSTTAIPVSNDNEKIANQNNAKSVVLTDIKVLNLINVKPNLVSRILKVGIGTQYGANLNSVVEKDLLQSGFFKSVDVKLNGSVLLISVVEKPNIADVNVEGAKVIKANDIKTNMAMNNVGVGGVVNEPLLNTLSDEIKEELLNFGKENPTVDISIVPLTQADIDKVSKENAKKLNKIEIKSDTVKVNVKINEGETTRIKKINFSGNTVFSNSELKRKIASSESGTFDFLNQNTRFSPKQLYSDFELILNEYKNVGYANASIPDVKFHDVGSKEKPEKQIDVVINEGDKYIFGKPEFILGESSKSLLNETLLLKFNKVKSGNLFNRSDLVKTKESIEDYLANKGRPFAKVKINFKESVTADGKNKEFIPQFIIEAYQEAVINNIHIEGVNKTKGQTIVKELRQKSGDVFNKEKLEVTNTKLKQTGFYREVDMTTKPSSTKNNDEIDAVDLNIKVTERRTGNATISAGYMQGSGLFAGVAVSDKNVFGTGKTVGVDAQFSRASKQLNTLFSDPHMFGQDKNLDLNVFATDYDPRKLKNNNNDYRLRRYGGIATVGLPISDFNKVYFGIGAEQMDLKTFGQAPLQYRRFINTHGSFDSNGNGKFKGLVTKATVSWSHNTTSDAYWGGKGHIASIGAETTLPMSKVKYVKGNVSYKQFFELGKYSTLMLHGQAGWGRGLGKTKDFPFFQNYQAGGIAGTPVRAFDASSLGPKVYDSNGDVVVLGGSKMFGFTAEANTKIPFTKDSSDMRIGAFVDVASVWDGKAYTAADSDNGISVYGNKTHKSTYKNELRAATGVAWTWYSPVGAIKLSYGVPIRKKEGDQVQRFQFSLGKTF